MIIQDAYRTFEDGATLDSLLSHFHQFPKPVEYPDLHQYRFVVEDAFCRENDVETITGVVISSWFDELCDHVCKVSRALHLEASYLRFDRNWELHWGGEPPTVYITNHPLVIKCAENGRHTDEAWKRVRCQASVFCRPVPEIIAKLDTSSKRIQAILSGYLDIAEMPAEHETVNPEKKPDIMSAIRAFG